MSESVVEIREGPPSQELEKAIYEGFREHAVQETGLDGDIVQFAFSAFDKKGKWLGAVVVKTFWGALHIKYLYVAPAERGKGVGTELMHNALKKGLELKCRFASVETMGFQALDFYKRLGFRDEFVRAGYDGDTTAHYLRRDFRT